MNKEDVLKLCENSSQVERVEATYKASSKFNNECVFNSLTTEDEVKSKIKELEDNYNKRLKAKQKAKAKQEELSDNYNKVIEQVKKAMSVGFTIDDICNIIESNYKEKYNSEIQRKIKELEDKTKEQLKDLNSKLL